MRIGISGHRDLTDPTAKAVDAAIRSFLAERAGPGLIGVSCLADGADQIFAQAIIDAGGQLVVIVPARRYRAGLPESSHVRYDALLAQAAEVLALPFTDSDAAAHMAASIAMLDRIDHLVAVWDGQPARAFGGTADVVREAEGRRLPITVVWPPSATRTGEP